MTPWVGCVVAVLVLAGCSAETPSVEPSRSTSPPATTSAPAPTPSSTATPTPVDPVSLQALMAKTYAGNGLRLLRRVATTDAYVTHSVSYRSGNLSITGLMNVPTGKGPFPALVLAHGYIDPDIYRNGQGLRREQDRLARDGFITLHVDYRNHAGSDKDPKADLNLRIGYTEDVINAVLALRAWAGPVADDRIGLVGRSMGGGVVYNVLTVQPGLVDAAVVFAPIASDTVDHFNRFVRGDAAGAAIVKAHGPPAKTAPFWRDISPRTFFGRVTEPLMIHHGTSDDSCPIVWSRSTTADLKAAGKDVTFHVYEGEEHAFIPQWPLSMDRTVAFLRQKLV